MRLFIVDQNCLLIFSVKGSNFLKPISNSMSKTSTGILGAFTGSIGPVTAYVRNGQNILRTSTSTVKYKPTALRTAQLEKMKVCNQFTKPFAGTGFFNKTFPAYGNTGNGFNRVTSVLMNQAVTGNFPNIHLSYPQVMISKGKLPSAQHAAATAMTDGNLYFNYTDNSNTGSASAHDTLILVAWCEELQQVTFSLNKGIRKDCEAILKTESMKGYAVETWMGFLSGDEQHASNSVYTGKVQL